MARQHHHDDLAQHSSQCSCSSDETQCLANNSLYTRKGSDRGSSQSTIMHCIQNVHTHTNGTTAPSRKSLPAHFAMLANNWVLCSLCKCRHCGRSFNEEAFARHVKMCTAERPGGPHAKSGPAAAFGGSPSRMAQGTSSGAPQQKPSAYTCYLCGQQYLSLIHI